MTTAVSDRSRIQEVPCRLEEVLGYQHPVLVGRFMEKLGISKDAANELFMDTKKFLYLCAVSMNPISPTKAIDFGWHEFILFTEDYADFCQKYFGNFVHHRPRNPNDVPTKGAKGQRARALAIQTFGENLSDNWTYPVFHLEASDPCDSCGCGAACSDD